MYAGAHCSPPRKSVSNILKVVNQQIEWFLEKCNSWCFNNNYT
jgi:hypothetical protein